MQAGFEIAQTSSAESGLQSVSTNYRFGALRKRQFEVLTCVNKRESAGVD